MSKSGIVSDTFASKKKSASNPPYEHTFGGQPNYTMYICTYTEYIDI